MLRLGQPGLGSVASWGNRDSSINIHAKRTQSPKHTHHLSPCSRLAVQIHRQSVNFISSFHKTHQSAHYVRRVIPIKPHRFHHPIKTELLILLTISRTKRPNTPTPAHSHRSTW